MLRLIFFVFLCLVCFDHVITIEAENREGIETNEEKNEAIRIEDKILFNTNNNIQENKTQISKNTNSTSLMKNVKNVPKNLFESGALMRAFYVFLGLSAITLLYFLIKSCRLRSGSQPPKMVRKYGVRARREDVEMVPLPLDDEEEEDIVFELNQNNR